jgi:hypothetical protein
MFIKQLTTTKNNRLIYFIDKLISLRCFLASFLALIFSVDNFLSRIDKYAEVTVVGTVNSSVT